eukprot:scaffold20056_cov33-Tisochrysis_lutea.AAC.1
MWRAMQALKSHRVVNEAEIGERIGEAFRYPTQIGAWSPRLSASKNTVARVVGLSHLEMRLLLRISILRRGSTAMHSSFRISLSDKSIESNWFCSRECIVRHNQHRAAAQCSSATAHDGATYNSACNAQLSEYEPLLPR